MPMYVAARRTVYQNSHRMAIEIGTVLSCPPKLSYPGIWPNYLNFSKIGQHFCSILAQRYGQPAQNIVLNRSLWSFEHSAANLIDFLHIIRALRKWFCRFSPARLPNRACINFNDWKCNCIYFLRFSYFSFLLSQSISVPLHLLAPLSSCPCRNITGLIGLRVAPPLRFGPCPKAGLAPANWDNWSMGSPLI